MTIHRCSVAWHCRDRIVTCGERTLVMGILNVTPDSFSDGGRFADSGSAVENALRMIDNGASIIDVGGESTRPGAEPVSVDEEIRRVVPVIKDLASESCIVSVDTTKAEVARQALKAGASIINDVSALSRDPDMPGVARESGAGVVLMHMLGQPRTMQKDPRYEDVVKNIRQYLEIRIKKLTQSGLAEQCLAVDPGIGFGKTVRHNVELVAGLPKFSELGRPVVVGLSRKSFLGKLTGREVDDRLAASLAAAVCAIMRGAHIIRVHDVKESCDAARIADMLVSKEKCDDNVREDTYTRTERTV